MDIKLSDLADRGIEAILPLLSSGGAISISHDDRVIGVIAIHAPTAAATACVLRAVEARQAADPVRPAAQTGALDTIFRAADLNHNLGSVTRRAEEAVMPVGITKNGKPWLVITRPWWLEDLMDCKFDWTPPETRLGGR